MLRDAAEFTLVTDNPCFSVAAPTIKIDGKKSASLAVKYTPAEGAANTGKLMVTCPSLRDLPPWLFYLKGSS